MRYGGGEKPGRGCKPTRLLFHSGDNAHRPADPFAGTGGFQQPALSGVLLFGGGAMMKLERAHIVGGVVGMIAAGVLQLVLYSVTFGRTVEKVDGMDERLKALEEKGTPKVRIGDLCFKLLDAQIMAFRAGDEDDREQVSAEMERLGCYDAVEAATVSNEEARKMGFPVEGE